MTPVPGRPDTRTVPAAHAVAHLAYGLFRFAPPGAREGLARAAFDALLAAGLPAEGGPDGPRIDPTELEQHLAAAGGPAWGAAVETQRRALADGDLPAAPPRPGGPDPRSFAVTLRRTFHGLRGPVRVRVPWPVDDPATDVLGATLALPEGASARAAPGRLEVRAEADGPLEVGVTWEVAARCRGPWDPAEPLGDADRALYTRPRDGLVRVTPGVAAFAAPFAGLPPAEAVAGLRGAVLDRVAAAQVRREEVPEAAPGEATLASGWGDCQLLSGLFASACRALGVPARLVVGYALRPSGTAFHTWVEVHLPGRGWAPHDLAASILSDLGRDRAWRAVHDGDLDHRLVVERWPREFCGALDGRLPAAWHLLAAQVPGGARHTFLDRDGAERLVEEVRVVRVGAAGGQ